MVGEEPWGIAITPDGKTAYVVDHGLGAVTVINTQTNQVVGLPIMVTSSSPQGIAISPDGKAAYVANDDSPGTVSVIDTQTNQVVGSPIMVGESPQGIAITPNQAPVASFTIPIIARPGVPVSFGASASTDPDGSIASYNWSFGDGHAAPNGGPSPSHVYATPGTYSVTLALSDNEGCSTEMIFTGQTALCDGSASASQSQTVKVAYPGVLLSCPKKAKHGGCRFKLQAVSKKLKGKAESAVASVKLKAGSSAIVSLKPKAAYMAKLATAKKVLVKQTATVNGSKRTLFSELRIVQ